MNIALVLEGGGMRGAYTAGVLDLFLEKQLFFKDIIAVSAGACTATSYIAGQFGRNLQIFKEYSHDKRYLSIENLVKTGSAFGIDFIFKTIPDQLIPFDYDAYLASPMKMTVVCTDLATGKPYYVMINDIKEQIDYIIASSSLPLVSRPVKIKNKTLLDGGVADPIPIHYAETKSDMQVIVLTRNAGYRKTRKMSNRLASKTFIRHKRFAKALSMRHIAYNDAIDRIAELEMQEKAIVIRPSKPIEIERFEKDINRLQDLYDLGYQDALAAYPKIMEMMQLTSKNDS